MKVSSEILGTAISGCTSRWLRQLFSPLCGLDKQISFVCGSLSSLDIITVGADLTGVHVVLGTKPRRPGFYHIGGSGLTVEEVLVRTLAETAERYAQMTAFHFGGLETMVCTYAELIRRGKGDCGILSQEDFELFDASDFAKLNFPYSAFQNDSPITWVKMESAVNGRFVWAPAQLILVGYRAEKTSGEIPFFSSVTTGTAVHRTPIRARLNAMLELVQIDAAVGHWYSDSQCAEIRLDSRTLIFNKILTSYSRNKCGVPTPRFYLFDGPDLPAFKIACVLRAAGNSLPSVAVGLGCSLTLTEALYKAWLEALGVWELAGITMRACSASHETREDAELPFIYDLDSNVGMYAAGRHLDIVNHKFTTDKVIDARDLENDFAGTPEEQVDLIISAFRKSQKELLRIDLTPPDIKSLGFVVERVWSPNTLSLPLPSAAPRRHRRFKVYGGFKHDVPHPYP